MDRAAYEKARALEKAGKAEEALRAFREAGAVEDVARLLAAARRYREAGEALFGSLGVRPAQAGQLEPSLKRRALSAAIWLSKGGETQVSVELSSRSGNGSARWRRCSGRAIRSAPRG